MSELLKMLRWEIRMQGPISVAQYMEMCLSHPLHGYYKKRDPFGVGGDFITAPEISQVFGELIGLWAGTVWRLIGRPKKLGLVEFGPGRGTLMSDALRAANAVPYFSKSIELHLVETSEPLRQAQHNTLADYAPVWHQNDTTLPDGPIIVIANEFFDALPIKQFFKRQDDWYEKFVDLRNPKDAKFNEVRTNIKLTEEKLNFEISKEQNVIEYSPVAFRYLKIIGDIIEKNEGGILIIDYGYLNQKMQDTLQAVNNHKYSNILENIGETDITYNINFNLFQKFINQYKNLDTLVTTQKKFLTSMGILQRAEIVSKDCLLYTSPSPRDRTRSRMPSSA